MPRPPEAARAPARRMYSGLSAREYGGVLYEAAVFGGEVTDAATAPDLLFRLTGIGVVETDVATGRFLQVNKTFCELVGYSEAELRAMTYLELTHPDDRARDAASFAALGRGERREGRSLTRVCRKDGGTVWLELHVTVLGEGDGAVNLAVVSDVTERRRAERTLRESEAKHRARAAELGTVLESMSDAVYIGGLDGITLANRPALEQLGYESPEELNRPVGALAEEIETRDAATGAFIPTEEQAFARALAGERVVQEVRVRHRRSGEERVVRCAASPVVVGGRVVAAVAVNTDVTERHRAEERLRRAAKRDAFLVELNDALSPLADPLAVQEEAARVLAEHLQTDGVHYTEIDETQTLYRVARDFSRGDVPSMVGTYPVAAFSWLGPEFLAAGQIVVADARTSPLIPEADRAAVAGIGVRALVTVPLIKGGRFVAALSAVSATPREWTPEEVERISETAERTWATLEHARAEAALRDLNETLEQRVAERTEALSVSEQRFAQAFYANPIPACMTSFGRETFVNVNDAFSELTGYARDEAVGRTSRELGMWSSSEDQQKLGEVQRDGKGFRNLELKLRARDGGVKDVLMSAAVVRLDGHEGYLKMFYDVSERKRTEEQMHQAIQAVMNDASWFSRSLIEQLGHIRAGGDAPVSVPFSKRERQVLERIAGGLNNDAIAAELGLAPQTVRNYVATIYDKIGVHTRVEAVVWARERGIVG